MTGQHTLTNEETAGAVGAATGGMTPQEGIEMNTAIIAQESETAKAARHETEWLAAHATAVATAQPSWADATSTEVSFTFDDEPEAEALIFSRKIGAVAIEQAFYVDGDKITPADDAEVLVDRVLGRDGLATDMAAKVGSDLIRAAQIVHGAGEISVEVIASVGSALGVSPSDLYAAREFNASRLDHLTLHELVVLARDAGVTPGEYLKANS